MKKLLTLSSAFVLALSSCTTTQSFMQSSGDGIYGIETAATSPSYTNAQTSPENEYVLPPNDPGISPYNSGFTSPSIWNPNVNLGWNLGMYSMGSSWGWNTWNNPYSWNSWGNPYGWNSWNNPYSWNSWGSPYGWNSWNNPYGWNSWGSPYGWNSWNNPYGWNNPGMWGWNTDYGNAPYFGKRTRSSNALNPSNSQPLIRRTPAADNPSREVQRPTQVDRERQRNTNRFGDFLNPTYQPNPSRDHSPRDSWSPQRPSAPQNSPRSPQRSPSPSPSRGSSPRNR